MTYPRRTQTPQQARVPDRLYVLVPNLPEHQAWDLARQSVHHAQKNSPKLTGQSSRDLRPYWGFGFFGIRWLDAYTWYQEAGTRPHLMRNLAGKTIPMWIDDPTGSERIKNPQAETRITASGKTQIKIFRRVAQVGQRKQVKRKVRGTYQLVDVPASYPGAPGRIGHRMHITYPGPHSGKIGVRNVGVRWYNPGIAPRGYLHHAIHTVCAASGLGTPEIHRK